jgi:hypothetical protein
MIASSVAVSPGKKNAMMGGLTIYARRLIPFFIFDLRFEIGNDISYRVR